MVFVVFRPKIKTLNDEILKLQSENSKRNRSSSAVLKIFPSRGIDGINDISNSAGFRESITHSPSQSIYIENQ